MMAMSQIWAIVGIMGAAFATTIAVVFRALSQHGKALSAEIGTVRAEVGTVRAEVGALHHAFDARFDGLRNEMLARLDHVSGYLSERIDGLSGRVDALSGRVDKLETRVESLDRDVHSLKRDVHFLTTRVMGAEPSREMS